MLLLGPGSFTFCLLLILLFRCFVCLLFLGALGMSHSTYPVLNHSEERHIMELLLIVYFLQCSVTGCPLCNHTLWKLDIWNVDGLTVSAIHKRMFEGHPVQKWKFKFLLNMMFCHVTIFVIVWVLDPVEVHWSLFWLQVMPWRLSSSICLPVTCYHFYASSVLYHSPALCPCNWTPTDLSPIYLIIGHMYPT